MIHKNYEEQLEIFISRGMKIRDKNKAIKRLENISYYKLKEFAQPFYNNGKYEKISFERLMSRYYDDKNIRCYLLHAIEKVEVSFKTRMAYLLGENHSLNYLEFKNWVDKNSYARDEIEKRQNKFREKLEEAIENSDNSELTLFFKNHPKETFPPIWMIVDLISFGTILLLYEMLPPRQKLKISKQYKAQPAELESWLSLLKFIRNKSAHNSNIIDLKIKTIPKIKNSWKPYLTSETSMPIAIIFFILKDMIKEINSEYGFGLIGKNIFKMVRNKEENAKKIGFANKESIAYVFGFSENNLNEKS